MLVSQIIVKLGRIVKIETNVKLLLWIVCKVNPVLQNTYTHAVLYVFQWKRACLSLLLTSLARYSSADPWCPCTEVRAASLWPNGVEWSAVCLRQVRQRWPCAALCVFSVCSVWMEGMLREKGLSSTHLSLTFPSLYALFLLYSCRVQLWMRSHRRSRTEGVAGFELESEVCQIFIIR